MKRLGWLVGALVVSVALFAWSLRSEVRNFMYKAQQPKIPVAVPFEIPTRPPLLLSGPTSTLPATSTKPAIPAATSTEETLPREVNLAVPFMLQAPNQNWDMPYQEACEEASMLMVKGYFAGTKSFTTAEMDKKILDFVKYQTDLGYGPDLTAAESKLMMKDYLQMPNVEILENPTALQIKQAVAAGKPVIIPADGKRLKNPNFLNGGPLYHMLVVKGYTKSGLFITNDPGTRRGPDYVYTEAVLMDAIHDWNGGDVPNGAKRVLIVSPS